MDGITLHMDKTILNMPVSASVIRMDYFRPSWMKRSNTDMGVSRKRNEKLDLTDARQNSSRANPMPVVSVQYDVPKTPPSPLMYRFRRLHTPLSSQGQRTRSEERVNQIINVDSHRLKGLGVGKCYSEYVPPPTAPEPVRLGASQSGTTPSTPGLSNSRTTLRQSVLPSPMSNSQSATPTRHQADADRSVKSSQSSAISQLTKIYTARQKHSNKEKAKDVLENKILTVQTQRNQFHHPAYLQSPVLFSQSYHDKLNHRNHSNKDRHEVKDKCHMEEEENEDEEEEDKNDYSSYQNVKNGYHLNHGEYNK